MGPGSDPARHQLGPTRRGDRRPRRGDRRLVSEGHGSEPRGVVLPFIIFTAIWGSTWIVIRGQLGVVPPQWSVTYRFVIAAAAMAAVARWKGQSLHLGSKAMIAALFLGFAQFCVNFN